MLRSSPLSDHVSEVMQSPIEVQALLASKGFLYRLLEIKINQDCAITGIGLASYVQHLAGVVSCLRRFTTALEQAKRAGLDIGVDDDADVNIAQSLQVSLQDNELMLQQALGTLTSFVKAHDPEAPGYNPTCPIDVRPGPKEEKIPVPQIPDALKKYFN